MKKSQDKKKRVKSLDWAYALELYNKSRYEKGSYLRVCIEDDLDRAGDAFAVEIIRALQFWKDKPQIVIQLCTGESPFIGYRKIGGDMVLEARGLYNPEEISKAMKRYGRIGAILDNWNKPQTQAFLKKNGLDPRSKPDMNKVIAFALDAIFPQKSNDYFAFGNLLNNVCDLWGVPTANRNFFYGDIYVIKKDGLWQVDKIPDEEYRKILESVDKEGLKILEFQAARFFKGDERCFALESTLRIEGGKAIGNRLKRDEKRDFEIKEIQIEPLKEGHIQYGYLAGMQNQALMMHEKLIEFGGAHICLLGVGPSYEGEGHIGFCERGTPMGQTCFMGAINDFDATFHIAGAHAKEFYGFKNMFVTVDDVRMPKFGFITYGPAEMMYRSYIEKPDLGERDILKEVILIVIATGNAKSSSVAKAIESHCGIRSPLSLTHDYRGVYVLDRTSARELRIERYPWEFRVKYQKRKQSDEQILSGIIRPNQIGQKLKDWAIKEGDRILFINPHMDDDFLAMMHLIKGMALYYKIYACYTSLGYAAVYSDYVLGLLEFAGELGQSELDSLNPKLKEKLLKELITEVQGIRQFPHLDYEVLPYMSEKEKALRTELLLIDLNERYDIKEKERKLCKNRFRNKEDVLKLKGFLALVEQRKPRDGGLDLDIMRYLKTSARFMEAQSSLMSLGISYKNIYWPLEVSFYGTPGRPLAIKEGDVNKIKDIIGAVKPRMVVFNGEGFPDFASHSNTEIGTYIAAFQLLKERKIRNNLVLFQWAGVWDRIPLIDSQISVILTNEELQDFYNAFNCLYPTQAPYAPVLNASSAGPQSFSQDVIVNARKSGQELASRLDLPGNIQDILKQWGGILNYKVKRLGDKQTKQGFLRKKKELVRLRFSIDLSSNTALTGPPPYPEGLNELSPSLIREMTTNSVISARERSLFSYGEAFRLSSEDMVELVSSFRKEMGQGLSGKESSLAMLPTFVDLPTGKEKGIFLALDLGGTIFRVLMVNLLGAGKKPRVSIEKYTLKATKEERKREVDYDYTRGSSDELFEAIARYIKGFLTKYKKLAARYKYQKPYRLGFTFSFPVKQVAIDQAIVIKMSKEFLIPELINQDVVQLLRKVVRDEELDNIVKVVSLNNDTVGALVARRYHDASCDIGGIVGTGTNFCYVESVENIHTLKQEEKARYGRENMIINVESGNFDKITQNVYDRLLDKDSINEGEHIAEKMVSGLYLGELTRLVLMDLVNKGLLFGGNLTEEQMGVLTQKDGFKTSFYDKIAKDNSDMLNGVQAQLIQWGIKGVHISLEDRWIVKKLCAIIARRSARITAAVVFAIITHIDKQIKRNHTVAIDGSLFEKYPHFKDDTRRAVREISLGIFKDDRSDKISFKLSPDGSGIGAAIIAAGR